MSFLDVVSEIESAVELVAGVLIQPRSIGGFIADCTVEEQHEDRLRITQHPVEQGASITDHAFKEPATVTITAGWSNSSPNSGGNGQYVQQIYAAFLALQSGREPFDVLTGKRAYTNMLVETISTRTDAAHENAMILIVKCQEIILVTTQTVTVPNSANMAAPALNAPTQNLGTVNAIPNPSSFNASGLPETLQ